MLASGGLASALISALFWAWQSGYIVVPLLDEPPSLPAVTAEPDADNRFLIEILGAEDNDNPRE